MFVVILRLVQCWEEIDFILLKEMGESPLMAGVLAKYIETVKLLIFHGGNVDAR